MFYRQLPAWSPLTLRALLAGLWAAWFSDGRNVRRALEQSLRDEYDPKDLYLTDSGTSALTLALWAVRSATDAPVALPAYCCYDVATAADGAAVPFLLYDVDPATLSPDLTSLRRSLEAGARSIVVAHLYGVPVDLARVQALAGEFGALIIEDAAQGSGCEWKGRPAGTHGALGILSFGRGKGVTGGGGGALLVNDDKLRPAVSAAWRSATGSREPRGSVKDFVILFAQWLFGRPSLYWIPALFPALGLGETTYHEPHPVGSITTLAAGVLCRTMWLVSAEVNCRTINASKMVALSTGPGHVTPPEGWKAGWLRFPVVLQSTAAAVLVDYHAALGVMRGYPKSLADLGGFGSRRLNEAERFQGARLLADRLVTMPTHRFVRGAKLPAF